jgi:acyl-CoA synthetase (AMP-forming)/AMP-acid ligase II
MLLGSMRLGEPCVLLPVFDPAAALDALEQFRCTLTLALPAMMQFILEEQVRKPRDLSSLRVIFAGGDSVPVALQARWPEKKTSVTTRVKRWRTTRYPNVCISFRCYLKEQRAKSIAKR